MGAREYKDEHADTTKRDKGTEFHRMMDMWFTDPLLLPTTNHFDVWGWYEKAVVWTEAHLRPRCSEIHSEVYVAFNFETGEVHHDPSVRDRKYPKMPGFLPGTTDLVCILRDGSLLVADWKTGGGTGADKQLLTLALGCRQIFRDDAGNLRPVVLSVLYATEDGVHPVEWAVTESDLLSHQHAMAFQLADVDAGTRTEPVVGIHCTQLYCNHLAYCPGITTIVEDLSESPQALLPAASLLKKREYSMTDTPISDEEAGYVMERITAARRQMKYYEDCMRSYINGGGRALTGDFEFKSTNSGFRWVKRNQ